MFNPLKTPDFDLWAFIGRNSKEIRFPEMVACTTALKQEHGFKKIGAVGFCYGGWAVFQLGGKGLLTFSHVLRFPSFVRRLNRYPGKNLVDCISTGHPSLLTKEEINDIAVPVQILAPEHDHALTPELKDYCNSVIPTLGVEYDYQYFPGMTHGFAVRSDDNDTKAEKALERAKDATVVFLAHFLHRH